MMGKKLDRASSSSPSRSSSSKLGVPEHLSIIKDNTRNFYEIVTLENCGRHPLNAKVQYNHKIYFNISDRV
jgi:hypothetical protein